MRCPFCQSDDTKVLDTRLLDDGSQVRRRRECVSCGERHSTRETVDLNLPRLIKSDESRQTFSEDKLRSGLLKALEKRPVSTSKIETAIQKIQRKLMAQNEREVSSSILGEWVMDELRALDEVAYIRFASVYRQFQDIEAFKSEIDKLMKK
jgi:transcriptional repressor NrdR